MHSCITSDQNTHSFLIMNISNCYMHDITITMGYIFCVQMFTARVYSNIFLMMINSLA